MMGFFLMKLTKRPLLRSACAFLLAALTLPVVTSFGALTAEPAKTHFENPVPSGAYSKEKPEFLFFKDITVTRKEKQELRFDVTLGGKIPTNLANEVTFYFGFDIDSDPATGGNAITRPGFGQDMGIWFVRKKGSPRFEESTPSVVFRGKTYTLRANQVKIRGDKIEFDVRGELFDLFPKFRLFVRSKQVSYERGLETASVDVDSIPRHGILDIASQ
jgi:hypothetical protein